MEIIMQRAYCSSQGANFKCPGPVRLLFTILFHNARRITTSGEHTDNFERKRNRNRISERRRLLPVAFVVCSLKRGAFL